MSAKGSNARVTTLNETVYGATPTITPGDSKVVPIISNNVNLTKALFDDPTIYSDGQSRFSRHGNKGVAGDVGVVYTVTNYDEWLESLFQNTFSTDVLKLGQTDKSFTMERGFLDIDQYAIYTGVKVNSFSLEVNTDGVIQSTFSMMGQDMTLVQSPQDSAPTDSAPAQPMVSLDGTFKEGGVATACVLLGISITINNNFSQDYCLGDDVIKEPDNQMIEIAGTVTAYFENETLLEKFLNETESSLEFSLDDGSGNSHTYLLPKIKYNTGDIEMSDAGNIPINMEFVALFDNTLGTSVQLTRSA